MGRSVFVLIVDVLWERRLNSYPPCGKPVDNNKTGRKEKNSSMLFSDMKANSKINSKKSWSYYLAAGAMENKGEQARRDW